MPKGITFPTAARAQSSAKAYRTVLDWMRYLPKEEVTRRIEAKIVQKDAIAQAWKKQQEDEHWKKQNTEYAAQAAEHEGERE